MPFLEGFGANAKACADVAAGGVDTMIGVVFEVVGEESEGSCFEFLRVFGGRGFCSFVVFVSNLRVGTKPSTYQLLTALKTTSPGSNQTKNHTNSPCPKHSK